MASSRAVFGMDRPMYVKVMTRWVSGTEKRMFADAFGTSRDWTVGSRKVLLDD